MHGGNHPHETSVHGGSRHVQVSSHHIHASVQVQKYKYIEVKVSFAAITRTSLFSDNILLQCQLVAPIYILTILIQLVTTGRHSPQK